MDVSFDCPCCGKTLRGRIPRRVRSLKCPNCLMDVRPPAGLKGSRRSAADRRKRVPGRLKTVATITTPLLLGLVFAGVAFVVFFNGGPGTASSEAVAMPNATESAPDFKPEPAARPQGKLRKSHRRHDSIWENGVEDAEDLEAAREAGQRQGATQYNARRDDTAAAPMGVAWRLYTGG